MILAVFGQKWEAAIPLVQLLALYALIYSCSFNLGDLYKAAGRPKILIWISVVNLALAVPILMIAANWGVTGVAAGQVVVGLAIGVVNWVVARRLEGIGTGTLVTSLRVPLIAAGTAAICAIAARSYVASGASNLMQFLTMACAGLLTYAISLAALMPQRWLNRAGQS
jgi:PST family polysaccharide transporter